MSEMSQPRFSRAAAVAFVLGASSLVLSLMAALPALYIGLGAVRAINASDGRLRGVRLAVAGIALALFTTLVTVLGSAALVVLYLQDRSLFAGCTNNLRQTGQAILRYHDQDGHFPAGTVPNPGLAPEQRLSWQAALVPLLSEGGPAGKPWEKLAGEIAFAEGWESAANDGPRRTNVPPYQCPAFVREFAEGRRGLATYPGVAGVGSDAAALPLGDPQAGLFGHDRRPSRRDISAGISTTMMAVETAHDNGPWIAGGPPTVRGLDPDEDRYTGLGRPFGGLHRDGLNVLWADGSVRFVQDDVPPDIFRAAARIHRENKE